jgi:hypothetical protein
MRATTSNEPENQAKSPITKPTTRATTSNEPHTCVTSHMGPITSYTDPTKDFTKDPTRMSKGSHKESTKDWRGCGNLEISHNFNIISELNVILAIQCRKYCLSINIILKLSWQSRRRSPVRATEERRSSSGDSQKEGQSVEARTKVKCKDLRMIHSMLGQPRKV